jgi:hypothetical protein
MIFCDELFLQYATEALLFLKHIKPQQWIAMSDEVESLATHNLCNSPWYPLNRMLVGFYSF